MLMSEPTAKSYVKRTCMFVLSIATFTFTFTFVLTAIISAVSFKIIQFFRIINDKMHKTSL